MGIINLCPGIFHGCLGIIPLFTIMVQRSTDISKGKLGLCQLMTCITVSAACTAWLVRPLQAPTALCDFFALPPIPQKLTILREFDALAGRHGNLLRHLGRTGLACTIS